jgi:hypothetical protein
MAEQAQDDGTGIIGKRKVPEGIPNPSLPPSTPGNRRGGSGKFGGGNTGITGKLILGQDRLNAYLSKNPYQEGTFEYDRYIANAPAFPDDAAYTAAIEPLRKAAKDRIASGAYKDANGNVRQLNPASGFKAGEQNAEEANYRQVTDETPLIKGVPQGEGGAGAIFSQIVENPSGTGAGQTKRGDYLLRGAPDENPAAQWLSQFTNDEELSLGTTYASQQEYAQALARSGDYVYIGKVEDTEGGAGYTRPMYVEYNNASASVTNLTEDEIRAYQAQLGLPQTGYVDPDMANLWDQAVETGRRYAMAGKQVELRFLFDQLVAATAAQGGLGGGGGGSAPNRES